MKPYHTMRLNLSFILLIISALSVLGSRVLLDLSYLHRIPLEKIEQAISDAITENADVSEADIDVSFSELGDAGMKNLITSILSVESSSKIYLDVKTRMNRLTPKGVSDIIAQILKRNHETNKMPPSNSEEDDKGGKDTEKLTMSEIRLLDLSWNNLHVENKGNKIFLSNLRKLVESNSRCPRELHFNRCSLGPAFCRSFGRGLINRYLNNNTEVVDDGPMALYLCGNPDIGDSGVAAIAAAIRSTEDSDKEIFSTLDLSSCNVGDAGAEALALALDSHPNSIKRLILSNNMISDIGACSIANSVSIKDKSKVMSLVFDNNPGISNLGAANLAQTIAKGSVSSLSLRSCAVKAEGVKAFGECLKTLSTQKNIPVDIIDIDLSGNSIGILKKKKKESLKSKATAKTASYVNFIGKQIKSGLKDVGLDNVLASSTVESDDEAEEGMDDIDEQANEPTRCGAKALASIFVLPEEDSHKESTTTKPPNKIKCKLGMRNTFLDHDAADALAAVIIDAKRHYNIDLVVDADLNNVWEDGMIRAVGGTDSDTLEIMAERHIEAMEAIRAAEERAARVDVGGRQYSQWSEDEEDDIYNQYDLYNSDNHYDSDDHLQHDSEY